MEHPADHATRARTRLPFDAANDAALLARMQAKKKLKKAASSEMKALADEIAQQHVPGTLTLIVVNRVARAQELFALLERISLMFVSWLSVFRSTARPRRRLARITGRVYR